MNKYLLGAVMFLTVSAFAQKTKEDIPKNWYQLDKATTGYYGISLDKAYAFVKTKKLKSKQVIVAVIDSGIDTLHEDLKQFYGQILKKFQVMELMMITMVTLMMCTAGIF